MIPADDPVRLLSACVEGMDLSELNATYDRIRKNQATPKQLFKIIVYANMNRIFSSRDIEKACRQNINFMYLLEGKPAPDHATIARFHSLHFSQCSKKMMAETTWLLRRLGEVGSETVFIDGTKIEANANKYTFVWKKAVTKNLAKMMEKITSLVAECEASYGLHIVYHDRISLKTLKRLRRSLYRVKADEGIEFVYGSGKRKSPLQRSVEQLEEYIDRLKGYIQKIHICGERNSYSKTDHDAPFMRLKEDAMLNGQLKPAILSDRGIQLRMNRSIQVEGSFATVKEDMNFRQYLYRGNTNVLAQSILVAIAHNINKLHHKIQSGRTGTHLFPLKKTG